MVTLTRAKPEDIQIFIDIEKTAPKRIYSPMLTEAEAREQIEKSVTYFIKDDDKIAGNVSYQLKEPDHAYIDGLVLKPEFQGKGIAIEAMQQLLDELRDYKTIDLVTHPDNTKAVALYESIGFKKAEVKENYFGDGEPRMRMILQKT